MVSLFRIVSKPILIAILFILVVFLSACSEKSENDLAVFKALDESLVNSNLTLARSSQTIYMSLEEKTRDPATSQKAMIWHPKAMVVKKYSSDIIDFIEILKDKLKKEAGFKKVAGKELFNENNMKAVNVLFNEKGMGKELHDKLKKFRRDILSIDIQMDSVFRQTLVVITKSFDTSSSKQQDFTGVFFTNIPVVAALAMLSKFQNNVKVNENRMITFCNNKIMSITYYTTYSAIVAQSYSHVKAGEKMEITAGVGYFSVRDSKPEVTVDGKSIEIDESGVAVYKFEAPTKAGRYSMPVKINFIGEDGTPQVITKDVEYTVIK